MADESDRDLRGLGAAWSALAEHTSDFVGLTDSDGVAQFMNRSVRGASPGSVVGKRLEEFLSPERALQVRAMLEDAKRTGLPSVNANLRVVALDGSERWFVEKCVPLSSSIGPATQFMLVRTETTHLRRTEAELSASEERYRVLFESNPDPVLVYDPESLSWLAVNHAAERMYGWCRDEFLERTVLDVYSCEDHAAARRRVAELLAQPEREHRGVVDHVRRDGSALRAEVFDHPIRFRGVAARMCVVRDVTERERLEAQLLQSQKMEAIGVFAGGVAHDFNNLLGIIAGFAETARESSPPGSEAAEDLSQVLDASRRAAELTKKLLVFSKKQLVSLEAIDLAEVVVEFASMLRRIVGNDIVLEIIQAHAPLALLADRTQIEQVILNMVMNARQAMPNGGKVTVAVARVAAGEPSRYFAELRVTDEGHGMDGTTAQRLFEPFFTTKAQGTGLGLAVVHGIVQQHNGTITVETSPGCGTTFRMLFPMSSYPVSDDTERLRLKAPRGSERVLVAEDEPQLRLLAERSLLRLGYRVVAARNGEEAVQQFEQAPDDFDLVVLDVVMPRLGGREALTRMRERRPDLKALFVTGFAPESTGMLEVLRQPGLGLLRKPFTTLELAERIRQVLG